MCRGDDSAEAGRIEARLRPKRQHSGAGKSQSCAGQDARWIALAQKDEDLRIG